MTYDAIVIGGSFAGLSAAMQLARARRRVLVIDAGLPRNRFAAASHGFFGQDGRAPETIIDEARRQVLAYPTARFVKGEATAARKLSEGFEVILADGEAHRATRLVLATGVADQLSDLPGLRERWGVSVLHCPYCHGYEVSGRRIGVLQSPHRALLLADWGPVTLFLNGVAEPDDATLEQLWNRGVTIERTAVSGLLGDAPELSGVQLADGRIAPVTALFTGFATAMASPLAEALGCAFHDGPIGPIVTTDDRKQTSVPGVYAAGDMAIPMTNATLASADGVMAGVGAHQAGIFSL